MTYGSDDSTRAGRQAQTDRRAQWQARANRRIEYAPGNPSDRSAVIKRNEYVTAAYADMYLRNPALYKWAGMAALTSAAVGRGMYMMLALRQSYLWSVLGLFGREVAEISYTLGVGNIAVFNDIYWQHMAYDRGGLDELEPIYRAGNLDPFCYEAWRKLDAGRRAGDQALIWAGNRDLLYYEQKETLQPAVYDGAEATWKELSGWIASPIPGHNETIEAFDPSANIGVFADRWRWIERRMLPAWQALSEKHPARVERRLHVRLLGGPPFLLPGMLVGRLGQGVFQAIGLGRLPKAQLARAH
jgi:hypothetical protein